MSRRYRLSRAARIDLLGIWNYLAERWSFELADKILADLDAGMDELARTPALGHVRPDLTDDPVRFFLVHRYLIVYVPDTTPLGIARILHAARDVRTILEE